MKIMNTSATTMSTTDRPTVAPNSTVAARIRASRSQSVPFSTSSCVSATCCRPLDPLDHRPGHLPGGPVDLLDSVGVDEIVPIMQVQGRFQHRGDGVPGD